jgi:nucleoside-triphosphatase THEP1
MRFFMRRVTSNAAGGDMPTQNVDGPDIIVLSGPSGCGKSSSCLRVAGAARDCGLLVRGLVSPPHIVGGVKAGIDALDMSSDERHPLAEPVAPGQQTARRWAFHRDTLAWGADVLRRATPCDLLMVDELGPLELLHGEGWFEACRLLQSGAYRWAIVVVRPSLVQRFLEAVPGRRVRVVTPPLPPDCWLEQMLGLQGDDGVGKRTVGDLTA